MGRKGLRTARVCVVVYFVSKIVWPVPLQLYADDSGKDVSYLGPNLGKVNTKLVKQPWFTLIPLRRKGSEPARTQPALLAQPARDARGAGRTAKAASAGEASSVRRGPAESVRSLLMLVLLLGRAAGGTVG